MLCRKNIHKLNHISVVARMYANFSPVGVTESHPKLCLFFLVFNSFLLANKLKNLKPPLPTRARFISHHHRMKPGTNLCLNLMEIKGDADETWIQMTAASLQLRGCIILLDKSCVFVNTQTTHTLCQQSSVSSLRCDGRAEHKRSFLPVSLNPFSVH